MSDMLIITMLDKQCSSKKIPRPLWWLRYFIIYRYWHFCQYL